MIQNEGRFLHRWLLPFVAAAALVLTLLFLIPFASGYAAVRMTLGGLLYYICMQGQNDKATLDFSYCLLVPPIVAFLIFLDRKEIARQPIEGSNAAIWLIIFSLFLYWLGLRSEMQVVGYAAMQFLVAGIILWLWGWSVFRQLLFPWAFLAFFWPLPFLDTTVAFPLRQVMVYLASAILHILGIPVIQNGTALLSAPNPASGLLLGERFRIDIADPCSGIRSLLALMMISALGAYLFLPKLWQQWTVFVCSIPLTVIGNLARVLILIWGSIYFGSAYAIGTDAVPSNFHENAGYAVYAVALGLEFFIGYLLMRNWSKEKGSKTLDDPLPTASEPERPA